MKAGDIYIYIYVCMYEATLAMTDELLRIIESPPPGRGDMVYICFAGAK